MSKRYAFRIKREASYIEEVDAIIVAKDQQMAEGIAAGLGEGQSPNWPDIERYNTWNRHPVSHQLVSLEAIDA